MYYSACYLSSRTLIIRFRQNLQSWEGSGGLLHVCERNCRTKLALDYIIALKYFVVLWSLDMFFLILKFLTILGFLLFLVDGGLSLSFYSWIIVWKFSFYSIFGIIPLWLFFIAIFRYRKRASSTVVSIFIGLILRLFVGTLHF